MENQTDSKQDCGCSDGCCTPPKKSNPWNKWIFMAIILAAVAIVTIKLINKEDTPPAKCCDHKDNPACCTQTDSSSCTQEKPCCSQSKSEQ